MTYRRARVVRGVPVVLYEYLYCFGFWAAYIITYRRMMRHINVTANTAAVLLSITHQVLEQR